MDTSTYRAVEAGLPTASAGQDWVSPLSCPEKEEEWEQLLFERAMRPKFFPMYSESGESLCALKSRIMSGQRNSLILESAQVCVRPDEVISTYRGDMDAG
jgi:hypothetical protein